MIASTARLRPPPAGNGLPLSRGAKRPLHRGVARVFRTVSRWSGVAVAAIGAVSLLGWLFDVTALDGVLPWLRTMRVNSAVGFLLVGSSIWTFNRADALP